MKKKKDTFSKPNFLRLVPIFSSLAPLELEDLSKIADFRVYKKKHTFFYKR